MKIWKRYTNGIMSRCASPPTAMKDLDYWRNNLFAGIMIYLLPLCVIPLVPGLYMSIITGKYGLAVIDVLTVINLLVVAFLPGMHIHIRKIIFITCLYIFNCTILYYIGMEGPGLLYLFVVCIFCILIFPAKYAYRSAFLNTFICILFGFAVPFDLLPWPHTVEDSTVTWIVISSNLVFLSFVSAGLIPRLFNGLQETIQNEKQLQHELTQKRQSLQAVIEKLEQKNSELEQFVYVASHDLQEPLRMITSLLVQLEKKYKGTIDDQGKQYIDLAVDGAQRMRQIILDLLEFSHIGLTEDELEDVDLNELVDDAQFFFRQQIEEKNAVITVDKLPVIFSHKSPVRQVFQNLISNALKYSKNGQVAEIRISVKETGSHWQFSISDNGIGIPAESFDKIFIIFQRLHDNNEYGGAGMGLAMCRKIVENLGGKIWLDSEPDIGSIFYFNLQKNN